MGKRKVPALNSTSIADISFLMLTFFLLTSSIDTQMGIQRRLPPPLKDPEEKIEIKTRNVLRIMVNMYDQLLVNGVPMNNVQELKNHTKDFITNIGDDPDMPEKGLKYIEEFGETLPYSKGVVSLQNDRSTSYKTYIAVQNQLAEAFNELRDEFSRQRFGKNFANLNKSSQEGVQKLIPISISEAEPSNYGGNR